MAVRRNMPLKGVCSWQARPSSGSATVFRPSAPRTRLIASPWRQTRRTKSSSSPRSPGWGLLTGSRQPGGRFSGSRVQPQSRTSPWPPFRGLRFRLPTCSRPSTPISDPISPTFASMEAWRGRTRSCNFRRISSICRSAAAPIPSQRHWGRPSWQGSESGSGPPPRLRPICFNRPATESYRRAIKPGADRARTRWRRAVEGVIRHAATS